MPGQPGRIPALQFQRTHAEGAQTKVRLPTPQANRLPSADSQQNRHFRSLENVMGSSSTHHRLSRTRPARRVSALLGCTALVALPLTAAAQDSADTGTYRLSPIIVDLSFASDDDANSTIAKELWTGGKVATSVLDTPASVSVVTQKEITQRNADKVEDVLEYTPGIVTDYYGTDDRNDYYLVRGFQASTYRDGCSCFNLLVSTGASPPYGTIPYRASASTDWFPQMLGHGIHWVTAVSSSPPPKSALD